jgi:hypothetical protein
MPGVVPLRPLGVGELLDGAVKIIRRYPKPTLALSAVLTTIVTIVDVAFLAAFAVPQAIGADSGFGSGFSAGSNLNPSTFLQLFVGTVLTGALVTVVSRAVLGQPATVRDAWDATRPRFWALIGVSLLGSLLWALPILVAVLAGVLTSGVGFLLLLPAVPATIYLYVSFSVAPAALILERIGVRAALRRSRVLTGRAWWRVFGILLLTALLTSVVASVLVVPVAIIGGISIASSGGTELGVGFLIITAVASGIAQILVAPYDAGMKALLYVDQRMRTEGLDVALQAAAATPTADTTA